MALPYVHVAGLTGGEMRRLVAATKLGAILAAIPLSGGCFATVASAAAPSTRDIQTVWEREAAYWNDQKSGDIGDYVALFHDGFVGWPCTADVAGHLPTAAQLGLKASVVRMRSDPARCASL